MIVQTVNGFVCIPTLQTNHVTQLQSWQETKLKLKRSNLEKHLLNQTQFIRISDWKTTLAWGIFTYFGSAEALKLCCSCRSIVWRVTASEQKAKCIGLSEQSHLWPRALSAPQRVVLFSPDPTQWEGFIQSLYGYIPLNNLYTVHTHHMRIKMDQISLLCGIK